MRSRLLTTAAATAAMMLVTGCGGSGESGDAGGSATTQVGADQETAAQEDADQESTSVTESIPPEWSVGRVHEDWPDEVWLPADLTPLSAAVEVTDGVYRASLTAMVIGADPDELIEAIRTANGAPAEDGLHATGRHLMAYTDLLPGHRVTYTLSTDGPNPRLVVQMGPAN